MTSKIHQNGAVSYDPSKDNQQNATSEKNTSSNSLSRRGTTSKLREKMRLRKSTYETPVPPPAPILPPTLSLSFDAPRPNSNLNSNNEEPTKSPASPQRTSSLALAPAPSPPPMLSNTNGKSRTKSFSKSGPAAGPNPTRGMTPAEIVAMQAMQPPSASATDERKNRKDPTLATPQEKLEAVRNAKLDIEMVNRAIEFCGSEIRMRGLASIGIFRPFRFSENQAKQNSLIQLLLLTLDPAKYDSVFSLEEASGRAPATPKAANGIPSQNGNASNGQAGSSLSALFTSPDSPSKELSKALNKANIHDVVALFKWSLRHTKLSFKDFGSSSRSSFDWYEQFSEREKTNGYPVNSLSLHLFPNLPPSTSTYLRSILSLLTTIGSHHSSNAMPCPRLCGMLGYWILGRIGKESHWNLDDTAKDWERAKNVLSHLVLAFIREMEGEKGVISIPTRLKELIEGYPYFPSTSRSPYCSAEPQSTPRKNSTNGIESTSDGKDSSIAGQTQIQTPGFPLAFSPPPQKAIRVNLKSQNLIISSKKPRAPSETLRAAFGVETPSESNASNKPEENVWKFIVEEGKKAEESSKAPRKRDTSVNGISTGSSNGGSNPGSPIPPPTPLSSNSDKEKTARDYLSSSSITSGNPTPAQEEERERIRDEAREKAVVLEDHARILKLVSKSLRERRRLAEEQEKNEVKSTTTTNGLVGSDPANSSSSVGLQSPFSSSKGLNKIGGITGSPEFDMTPGSESAFLSSPASRPSPFSRSVSEFGTFSSPSSAPLSSQPPNPDQSNSLRESNMRRTASHNGNVITPELDTLPEDSDTKYTWLNGFSNDEKPVDLSFSSIATLQASASTTNLSNSATTLNGSSSSSSRPRRQPSFGSMKRKSLRSSSSFNNHNQNSASTQGGSSFLDSLPPPPPSFTISSIEIFAFDEAFQSFWQDSLLEGSLPPFVLVALKESLLKQLNSFPSTVSSSSTRIEVSSSNSNSKEESGINSDGITENRNEFGIDSEFLKREKINYVLIDEVATPPLPKGKPQVANSIDGASYDGRRSFAPSIRSLSASIRKLTNSWRRSKKDV